MRVGPTGGISGLGVRGLLSARRRGGKRALFGSHPWYQTGTTCEDPGVFIVGCGRSGTTLLREMFNRHPDLAIGPETTFLCDFLNPTRLAAMWGLDPGEVRRMVAESADVVAFAERFFRAHAAREGKARWGEKTPRNIMVLPWLMHAFPNGRFIHIIRDGRDVACSRSTFKTHRFSGSRVVERRAAKSMPLARSAGEWVRALSAGMAFRGHPRYAEVRYESLLEDAEPELRRLCEFAALPFDEAMVKPGERQADDAAPGRLLHNPEAGSAIRTSARGRWRRDLDEHDRRVVARTAGELLILLGYAEDDGWVTEGAGD